MQFFTPTKPQALAKSRLMRAMDLRHGLVDIAALSLAELVALTGDRRTEEWLRDPDFAAWLTDRDAFAQRAQALKEIAVDRLEELAVDAELGDGRDGTVTAKDRLAAMKMLFELTGSFPRKEIVRFADRDLDAMPDDEVQRQLAETRKRLSSGT